MKSAVYNVLRFFITRGSSDMRREASNVEPKTIYRHSQGEVKPVDRKWTSMYEITPVFCLL